MELYWLAIDLDAKEKIIPTEGKIPEIFHPDSPFPGMVMMMNCLGSHFQLINSEDWEGYYYSEEYKDITNEVYEKYFNFFSKEGQ